MVIWSNKTKTFDAPSGITVHANLQADGWYVVDASPERLEIATAGVCSRYSGAPDWKAHCLDFPDTNDREDVRRWIDRCVGIVPLNTAHAGRLAVSLLGDLRLTGVLLWAAGIRWIDHPVPWLPPRTTIQLDTKLSPFERSLVLFNTSFGSRASPMLLALSPAACTDDLSEEAILAVMQAASEHTALQPRRQSHWLMSLSRVVEGQIRSDGSTIQMSERSERILLDANLRRRRDSRYGSASDRSDAAPWILWFDELSERSELKQGSDQHAAHRRLLEFLSRFDTIPPPSKITRERHIVGPSGLLSWLQGMHDANSVQYGVYIQFLSTLFDVLCDEGEADANPFRPSDIPSVTARNNKSNKALIPKEIERVIRDVVTELAEHAFAQAAALPEQQWRPAGVVPGLERLDLTELLPPTIMRRDAFKHLAVTVRGEDGTVRQLLNPVLPVAISWLVEVPNRGVEVREADSGEADEYLQDLSLEHTPAGVPVVRAVRVRNKHPLATRGRMKGAIRKLSDGGRDMVGLYATVNKSQRGGHKDGKDRGREIPWEDASLLMSIQGLRRWQGRFNPADRKMSRDEFRNRRSHPSDGLRGKLDKYVYLFRYLQDQGLATRLDPCSYTQLHYFFMDVLDEVEARIGSMRSEGGEASGAEAPELVLSRGDNGRALRCAYSLHCMRVTRITALAKAGMPLWILSEIIAGHANILMTLYYIKTDMGDVFDALAAARSVIETNALVQVANRASRLSDDDLQARYVRDAAYHGGGNQIPGFWRRSLDGLCPNGATLCHIGGPLLEGSKKHVPVEGDGENCGLCRFNLTGPSFIPGQVLWINAILYQVRKQGKDMQALWEKRRQAGSDSARAAIDERIARVDAKIDLTTRGLHSRILRLEKSVALARLDEAGQARGEGVPADGELLLTHMSPGDVRAALRETSDLGMLDEVSRIAALIPETGISDATVERNLLVDQLLHENGIEGLLYKMRGDVAALAGDALMDGIRARAPAGVSHQDYVDRLARGETKLLRASLPDIAAEVSAAVGRPIRLMAASDAERPVLLEAVR